MQIYDQVGYRCLDGKVFGYLVIELELLGVQVQLGEKSITIWLYAELDLLVKRCARRDTRPLLRSGDPREILASLIEERYPIYAQADITVKTDDGPHVETVDKIIAALQDRASRKAPS